ncbi:U-box domain-containing protein 21-like [Cryptomeria japonica]|uniref:U-box domain-containing protein 21-like n=1 Tax=Cryptomeria japonica TaxID=3369 RepID=UPI0027DA8589|nr:U-box domain-containing protein 21-like [Cryptomeria japonica]
MDIEVTVPRHLRCPISLEIMKDPVTLSTGITYDRHSIETWLDAGNNVCPDTSQNLHTHDTIPNHALRRIIQDWCVANSGRGVERISTPKAPLDPAHLNAILAEISSGEKESIGKLRRLGIESDRNKKCIASSNASTVLASLFAKHSSQALNRSQLSAEICENPDNLPIPPADIPPLLSPNAITAPLANTARLFAITANTFANIANALQDDMPCYLWAEACSTAVYIQNRIPHKVLGKMTPEEAFTRKKPDVSHFRIFGSLAYCHVPGTRRIIVRHDVKFMEDKAFRRSRDLPVDDQSEQSTEAPRITQSSQGQQSSSTVTSTSNGSGGECSQSIEHQVQEEMHQKDMEVDISSSTVGSRNREVQQRDTQDQHSLSVHGRAKESALDSDKACAALFARIPRLWILLPCPKPLLVLCAICERAIPRERKTRLQFLREMISKDKYRDIIGKIEGLAEGLVQLLREPISPAVTKASLAIIYNIALRSRYRSKVVEAGTVPLLVEMLVDGDRSICERALLALDVLCCCTEGRAAASAHALTVPVVVKKMLRVSNSATELVVSVLWNICQNSSDGEAICEALNASAFDKLLLLVQLGCCEQTREKSSKLLKLFNAYTDDWKCAETLHLPHVKRSF